MVDETRYIPNIEPHIGIQQCTGETSKSKHADKGHGGEMGGKTHPIFGSKFVAEKLTQ